MKKISKKQAREIRMLTRMKEEEINTSDIPEIASSFPRFMGKFYRPIKQSITMRLDADVIAWLKLGGRGYQTRANRMLRSLMEKDQQKATDVATRAARLEVSNTIKTATAEFGLKKPRNNIYYLPAGETVHRRVSND